MFVPVQIAEIGDVPALAAPGPGRGARPAGLIEIDLGSGRRIRVDRAVDADALRRVLEALAPR
jgi:transposase